MRNSAEKNDTRGHCYISVSKVVYLFILILIKCQGLLHSSKLSLFAKSIYLFTGVQRLENFITMSVYVLRLILCGPQKTCLRVFANRQGAPACTLALSGQRLCYMVIGKYIKAAEQADLSLTM